MTSWLGAIAAVVFVAAIVHLTTCLFRLWHDSYNRRADEAVGKLAKTFLSDPDARWFGYPLARKSGVGSGVIYPALQQLLDKGWLECGWEDETEAVGRPPRRWYRLTEMGRLAILVKEWEASDG